MNLVSIFFNFIKNDIVNDKIVAFANQTLDFIVPENLKNTSDYLNLRNKNIYFNVTDLNLFYRLNFSDQVELSRVSEIDQHKVDLLIKTSQYSIASLVNKNEDVESLIKQNKLNIEGDNALLISLINFASRVDFSSENVLSKYIGDVPAYFVTRAGKQANKLLGNVASFVNDANVHQFSNTSSTNADPFRDDSLEANKENKTNPIQDLIENKLPNAKQILNSFIKQIK